MAKNKRLRTWDKYDDELEAARAAESAAELIEGGSGDMGHVTVTEMISPVSFWVQVPGSEKQLDHIFKCARWLNVQPFGTLMSCFERRASLSLYLLYITLLP